jgi:hypothetical protein
MQCESQFPVGSTKTQIIKMPVAVAGVAKAAHAYENVCSHCG